MNINTKHEGKTLTVTPEDRIDTSTAPEFQAKLEAELGDAEELIFDFSKIDYISSAGLRVLITYVDIMEERGGKIKSVGVGDMIRKIFDVTGFLDLLNIE